RLGRRRGRFDLRSRHAQKAPRGSPLTKSYNRAMADAVEVLRGYYRAFSTLKIDAVLSYFSEPSMLVGPQGPYAANTHELLAAASAPTLESLRARGYGRSELDVRDVKVLSATTTLVLGIARRYKVDGADLDQAGVTYVMHLGPSGWKIAVLLLHDPV